MADLFTITGIQTVINFIEGTETWRSLDGGTAFASFMMALNVVGISLAALVWIISMFTSERKQGNRSLISSSSRPYIPPLQIERDFKENWQARWNNPQYYVCSVHVVVSITHSAFAGNNALCDW